MSADPEPRDMGVMRGILREMGVMDHEPAVLHHLMEFTYKYITGVLEDAKVYSEHASKDEVDLRDVKLAIQMRLDHCYTLPPPREFLLEIARDKNSTPMPLINERFGIRLPPDRFCLTATNMQLVRKEKSSPREVRIPASMPTLDNMLPAPEPMQVSAVSASAGEFAPFEPTPVSSISPPEPKPPTPSQMSMKALKRKHEDDYDDF